jgi:Lysyl oxidase
VALSRPLIAVALAAGVFVLPGIGGEGTRAAGTGAHVSAPEGQNPCLGAHRNRLRCPDLQMGRPADMYLERSPRGRSLLRATNNVKSRGRGPLMLRGRRTGHEEMSARQHIYRLDGSRLVARTGAELYFKYVPGQGHYWKMSNAARFELWTVDSRGRRGRLVRTGPKVYYCLRDLKRTSPGRNSPRGRVFPGCSRDPGKRSVTLGTSAGWSDVYPATYHEQWIDVTGLRGCFAYVHRADPRNHIYESNETNNDSQRIVRLPFGRSHKKCVE